MIYKINDFGDVLYTLENSKFCSFDIFGDKRQIERAIKNKSRYYGYYWIDKKDYNDKTILEIKIKSLKLYKEKYDINKILKHNPKFSDLIELEKNI